MFGVIEAREDLALGAEAHAEVAMHGGVVDDLDRHLRRILAVRALAQIYRAGATVAQNRNQLIVADHAADQRLAPVARGGVDRRAERMSQGTGGAAGVTGQQFQQLIAQVLVAAGFLADEGFAFVFRQFDRPGKQILQPFPALVDNLPWLPRRGHSVSGSRFRCGLIWRSIQALARRISRSTVASETFSVSDSS